MDHYKKRKRYGNPLFHVRAQREDSHPQIRRRTSPGMELQHLNLGIQLPELRVRNV
jgi:hypothetical protein